MTWLFPNSHHQRLSDSSGVTQILTGSHTISYSSHSGRLSTSLKFISLKEWFLTGLRTAQIYPAFPKYSEICQYKESVPAKTCSRPITAKMVYFFYQTLAKPGAALQKLTGGFGLLVELHWEGSATKRGYPVYFSFLVKVHFS